MSSTSTLSSSDNKEINVNRQIWETDEMWKLRRNFIESYGNDKRFSKNRLLCLSQTLVNMEFLGCTYNEKLMNQVNEMAADMVESRRENRQRVVDMVFNVKNPSNSESTVKRISTNDDDELPKKKLRPDMVDLGAGFWRQVPADETPRAETKLKSIQLLKAQITIAPMDLDPIQLLNFACNRCKFAWSLDFFKDTSKCELKIENVLIVRQHNWGNERLARVELCRKANLLAQRTSLDVREVDKDMFHLYTAADSRKIWEGPDYFVYETVENSLRLLKNRIYKNEFATKWRAEPNDTLKKACAVEKLPFELKKVSLGGWRQDLQIWICGVQIFSHKGKAASAGKEAETLNEVCLKAIELLLKQPNAFRLVDGEDGCLTFTSSDVLAANAVNETQNNNDEGPSVVNNGKTSECIGLETQLRTLKMHLKNISAEINAVQRLDQACKKSKMTYVADISSMGPPFSCSVAVSGAFVAKQFDACKKGAKLKACMDTIDVITKPYVSVVRGGNSELIVRGSDDLEQQTDSGDEAKQVDTEVDTDLEKLKNFVLFQQNYQQDSRNLLFASATLNRINAEYIEHQLDNNRFRTTFSLAGVDLASGESTTKKESNIQAADKALDKLRRLCFTIHVKTSIDPSQTEIDVRQCSTESSSGSKLNNSFASKMMQKMGWSGGGIGKNEQGIKEPVQLMECFQRQGLGSLVDKSFRDVVRQVVDDYVNSDKEDDLVFPSSLSAEQRKYIHQMISKFSFLKCKSYGFADERQLTIQKKRTATQLLRYILDMGGETGKYKLINPTNS